jgi:hypothetical protein
MRLSIASLISLNKSTLRQGTRDVNAVCVMTDGACEKKKDPSLPGSTEKEWANRYFDLMYAR